MSDGFHPDGNRSLKLGFILTGRREVYRNKGVEGQYLPAEVSWCEHDGNKPRIMKLAFVWTEKDEKRKGIVRIGADLHATVRLTSLPVFEQIASIRPGLVVHARASFWEPELESFHVEMPRRSWISRFLLRV